MNDEPLDIIGAARRLVNESGFAGARAKVAAQIDLWQQSKVQDAANFIGAWERITAAIDQIEHDGNSA